MSATHAMMLARGGGAIPTTWSITDKLPNTVLTNGNLTGANNGGGNGGARSNTFYATGKRYFERKLDASGISPGPIMGLLRNTATLNTLSLAGQGGDSCAFYSVAGNILASGAFSYGADPSFTCTINDVVGYAVNFDAGKVWLAKNNSYASYSGDPVGGANPVFTFSTGHSYCISGLWTGIDKDTLSVSSTVYSPPTGYLRWDA